MRSSLIVSTYMNVRNMIQNKSAQLDPPSGEGGGVGARGCEPDLALVVSGRPLLGMCITTISMRALARHSMDAT